MTAADDAARRLTIKVGCAVQATSELYVMLCVATMKSRKPTELTKLHCPDLAPACRALGGYTVFVVFVVLVQKKKLSTGLGSVLALTSQRLAEAQQRAVMRGPGYSCA